MHNFKSLSLVQKLLIAILSLGLIAVGVWLLIKNSQTANPPAALEVNSFEECAAAGYPVMESYPRRCAVPGGETFTEELSEIVYENADEDMIRVELPYPGAVVGKEFVVVGEARGYWFFEGSFPLEVRSPNGDILAATYATAEGEWMTTDFVSFKSEMFDLPSAYIGPATLILRRDNPSGLPENDASISFPIVVEY